MQDIALSLIQPYLMPGDALPGNRTILWIVDENIIQLPSILASSSLQVMTNRYDLFQEAKHKKIKAEFNDFDFSVFDKHDFDLIVYRVSKERPVVHHIINQSFHYLKKDGQLVLFGHNQEGIKTHIKNAEKRYAQKASIKLDNQFRTAILRKEDQGGQTLDDKSYTSLRDMQDNNGCIFQTKPGLFGWNKFDAGSKFLANNLETLLGYSSLSNGTVLDLGCGYGYLSVIANALGDFHITATDNNAAAILACKQNFQTHNLNGQVLANDCGMEIKQQFDGIICNPPFHTGFNTSEALTEKFIKQIHRLLKKQSFAFLVCNQFLRIEDKASALFSKIELTHRNKSFKLLRLQK